MEHLKKSIPFLFKNEKKKKKRGGGGGGGGNKM
jgi:hypothetical protein